MKSRQLGVRFPAWDSFFIVFYMFISLYALFFHLHMFLVSLATMPEVAEVCWACSDVRSMDVAHGSCTAYAHRLRLLYVRGSGPVLLGVRLHRG